MSRRRLFGLCALVWLVACGPKVPDRPRSKADALVAEAEDILRKAQQLDYRAPASSARIDARTRAADLYRQACELQGGVSPCVWAISLSIALPRSDSVPRIVAATEILGAACLKEPNSEACRIFDESELDGHPSYYADARAACDKGLAAACLARRFGGGNETSEELGRLFERSCQLGDPRGCLHLVNAAVDDGKRRPELDAALARLDRAAEAQCERGFARSCSQVSDNGKRTQAAAVDGCARGYLDECEIPVDDPDVLDRQLARVCSLTGRACPRLAKTRSNLIGIRDALEHACQFRTADACVKLVQGYRDKAFPEPVPGRTQAIVTYLCRPNPDFGEDMCSAAKE